MTPLTYRIDPREGIVTITGDYASAGEWQKLLADLAGDVEYRRGFSFIRDLRESQHPVGPETVIAIITVVRKFWAQLGVHRAAIVTRPGIDAPAVIAHALASDDGLPLRAFASYDDAVAWVRQD